MMDLRFRKQTAWLLTFAMLFTMLPGFTTAADVQDNAETVGTEEPVYTVVTSSVLPDVDLPDNDELFAMYAEQKLYGNGWAVFGSRMARAGEKLSGDTKKVYDALVPIIKAIASGERASAQIGLGETLIDIPIDGTYVTFTADADVQFEEIKFTETQLGEVVSALLADYPYDMYWCDKTKKVSVNCIDDGSTIVHLRFNFVVAGAYAGADDYTADTEKTGATKAAVTNANAVVEANKGMTDYEKLTAYKEYICDHVSYNDEAVDENYQGGYGDPWQLIYVFDENAETKVVCEGYAKAFQYLCDLGGLNCISVTGEMAGGTGAGGHMWNIVTLDGANYLVDVTNCDEGTIGAPDNLFMVGNASGDVENGYVFTLHEVNISFDYDADTKSMWSEAELTLAATDYGESAEPVCSCETKCTADSVNDTCAVCGADGADLADCEGTAAEEPETYTVRIAESCEDSVEIEGTPAAVEGQELVVKLKNTASKTRTDVKLVSVTVNGSAVSYNFDSSSNTLTVAGEYVGGDVEITAYAYVRITVEMNGGQLKEDSLGFTVSDDIATLEDTHSYAGGSVTPSEFFEMIGYALSVQDDNGSEYNGELRYTGDMALECIWTPNVYTVTWNVEGETSESQQTYDTALVLPEEPTKSGFIFDGWFTAADGGEEVDGTTIFRNANHDTVYYAEFTACSHSNVTYLEYNDEQHTVKCGDCGSSFDWPHNHEEGKCVCGKKIKPVVTMPKANDLSYSGEEQELISAGSTTGGTMQYSLDNASWSTELPKAADADTYTVYCKVVGDADYEDTDVLLIEVTIAPKTITITGAVVADLVYDAEGGYPLVVTDVDFDGADLVLGTDYTAAAELTSENIIGEGTAEVTVELKNDNYTLSANTFNAVVNITTHRHEWNYSVSGDTITASCVGTGECALKTAVIKLKAPADLTYNGSKKTVAVEQTPAGTFSDLPEVKYTFDPIQAGTYTASLTYGDVTASLTFTIERAVISHVSVNVAAPEALAEVQTTVEGGTGYSATIGWDTGAAMFGFNTSYTATVYLRTDSNHMFADGLTVDDWKVESVIEGGYQARLTKTFPATRKAKLLSVDAPADKALSGYHTDADTVIAELPVSVVYETEKGSLTADIRWICENYNAAPGEANTFTWEVKSGELTDYDENSIATSGTITVTNGGAIGVTNIGNNQSITYSGETYDVSVMFEKDVNAGAASYEITGGDGSGSLNGSALTITKAGTIEIKMTTKAQGTYAAGSVSAVLTVNKALGGGEVSIEGWTYGDAPWEPVVQDNTGAAAFMYIGTDYSSTQAPTKAGDYTVHATFAATDLYEEATDRAEFTIEQKEVTASVSGNAVKTYDGTNAVPAGHSLSIVLDGLVDSDTVTTDADYTYDGVNAGTTEILAQNIALSGEKAINYKLKNTAASADCGTIEKADPTYTIPADLNAVYGDTLVNVMLPEGFAWEDASVSVGNTGTNIFNAKYTPADTVNYNTVTGIAVSVMVKAAVAAVTKAPAANTGFVYDGTAHSLVTAGTAAGGEMQYSMNKDSGYSNVIPTGIAAGTYTVWYKVVGDENHSDSVPVSIEVHAAKADLTVSAKDNTITYGDVPEANGVEYSGFVGGETESVLDGTLTYTYDYNQYGDIGTYKITPSGLISDNYEISFADGELTVNAKQITVTAVEKFKIYGDADPELTYVLSENALVNGDTMTGKLSRTAGENTGIYGITQGTLTAGKNYAVAFVASSLTIYAKGITAADFSLDGTLKYTGSEQTQRIKAEDGITYTVTGNKATEAGSYVMTITGTGNCNGEVKLEWSIGKAEAVISAAPAAKDLTYDGNDQVLVVAGTSDHGTVVYSLAENGEYTETIPTGNAAGTYTVWYKVVGDENHSDSVPASVTVIIRKAGTVANPVISPESTQFDESVTVTITCDTDGATVYYTTDGTLPTTSSTVYTGAFTITENTEVYAYAVKSNMDDSAAVRANYVKKSTLEIEVKLDDEIKVSEELAENAELNTPEKIEIALQTRIAEEDGFTEENSETYEAVLMYSVDGGTTWQTADEEHFPEDGKLYLTLPYPEGTSAETHDFTVAHMFTSSAFGKIPGEIEIPEHTETEDGLSFYVTGLSPITVGWTRVAQDEEEDSDDGFFDWWYALMMMYNQKFTITAEATDGGTVSPAGISKVQYNKDLKYTITPDEGYMIDQVFVDGISVGAVDVYKFDHVRKNHTITAIFKEIPWLNPFTDVNENDWFYEDVEFVSENGLMIGTNAAGTVFSPEKTLTRAMLVTVLWRAAGQPIVDSPVDFLDVPENQWYSDAIDWASANGIVLGYGDGNFGTNNLITREQLATIIYRYERHLGGGFKGLWMFPLRYDDAADVAEWAYEAICWLTMHDIYVIREEGMLDPKAKATRAEAAAFLRRYCETEEE